MFTFLKVAGKFTCKVRFLFRVSVAFEYYNIFFKLLQSLAGEISFAASAYQHSDEMCVSERLHQSVNKFGIFWSSGHNCQLHCDCNISILANATFHQWVGPATQFTVVITVCLWQTFLRHCRVLHTSSGSLLITVFFLLLALVCRLYTSTDSKLLSVISLELVVCIMNGSRWRLLVLNDGFRLSLTSVLLSVNWSRSFLLWFSIGILKVP